MTIRFGHTEVTRKKTALSFEFFPPRSDKMTRRLWCAIGQLELLDPEFFSVTYGALGSAIDGRLRDLYGKGIRRVLALRGDCDDDNANERLAYRDSVAFVEGIRKISDFDITVAAYPEVHPRAQNAAADLVFLKRKFEADASRAITQFFFDADTFLRFRDSAAACGLDSIVPGILPVHDYAAVCKFSQRCGASIPARYAEHFEGMEGNASAQYHLAVDLATELCQKLIDEGVDALHFYTLNRTDLCFAICQHLGSEIATQAQVKMVA
ncbi:MAG: methylenetetrahydrofolate reductase [Pseudomonadota bacterium]